MHALSAMNLKTEWMLEQLRLQALSETLEKYDQALRRYYRTCEGGDECTRLFHELEELGADMDVVVDLDLEIRDEIWPVI